MYLFEVISCVMLIINKKCFNNQINHRFCKSSLIDLIFKSLTSYFSMGSLKKSIYVVFICVFIIYMLLSTVGLWTLHYPTQNVCTRRILSIILRGCPIQALLGVKHSSFFQGYRPLLQNCNYSFKPLRK